MAMLKTGMSRKIGTSTSERGSGDPLHSFSSWDPDAGDQKVPGPSLGGRSTRDMLFRREDTGCCSVLRGSCPVHGFEELFHELAILATLGSMYLWH